MSPRVAITLLGLSAAMLTAAIPAHPPAASPGAFAAGAGRSQRTPFQSLEDTIVALEKASWVAWKDHDGEYFSRFLSDDHIEVGPNGFTGKAQVVAGVRAGGCVVSDYVVERFKLTQLNRETVVLTYFANQHTLCGGRPVPAPVWVASVFVLRDNRWQNAVYQHTKTAG